MSVSIKRGLSPGGVLVALGLALAMPASADADVLFFQNGTLQPPREQVLFNDPSLILSGNPVQGITNETGTIIEFGSNEPLMVVGGGQSRIRAQDGGFSLLTIDPETGFTFDGLGFNLMTSASGQVTITAFVEGSGSESATFDISRTGENRFHLIAVDGQRLTGVSIETTVDMDNVRQVRIGGLIPEPGSLGLIAAGGLLTLRRRR